MKVLLIRAISTLVLTTCLLAGVACSRTILVRQSIVPVPEEAKGLLYVATNKPLTVGIEGSSEVVRVDVGGYYLMHATDVKALLEALAACRKD